MNEPKWMGWLRKVPSKINTGTVYITALISFVLLIIANWYRGIIIIVVVLIIGAIFALVSVLVVKNPPLAPGLPAKHKYPQYKMPAIVGIVALIVIPIVLLFFKSPRSFVRTAIIGTSTPTITPTTTNTPTPTITPTPTATPLADIAYLNIQQSYDRVNSRTVYTAQLSIEPLEYGTVNLEAPTKLKVGESGYVRFKIIPDSALANVPQVYLNANVEPGGLLAEHEASTLGDLPNYAFLITNRRIQIYPVMTAKLEGVNFEISPSEAQSYVVVSSLPVEWLWVVTPNKEGNQLLNLNLTIPVISQKSAVAEISHPLENFILSVTVENPQASIFSTSPQLILFTVFLGIYIALMTKYLQNRLEDPIKDAISLAIRIDVVMGGEALLSIPVTTKFAKRTSALKTIPIDQAVVTRYDKESGKTTITLVSDGKRYVLPPLKSGESTLWNGVTLRLNINDYDID
jgi:hypothetical protein